MMTHTGGAGLLHQPASMKEETMLYCELRSTEAGSTRLRRGDGDQGRGRPLICLFQAGHSLFADSSQGGGAAPMPRTTTRDTDGELGDLFGLVGEWWPGRWSPLKIIPVISFGPPVWSNLQICMWDMGDIGISVRNQFFMVISVSYICISVYRYHTVISVSNWYIGIGIDQSPRISIGLKSLLTDTDILVLVYLYRSNSSMVYYFWYVMTWRALEWPGLAWNGVVQFERFGSLWWGIILCGLIWSGSRWHILSKRSILGLIRNSWHKTKKIKMHTLDHIGPNWSLLDTVDIRTRKL